MDVWDLALNTVMQSNMFNEFESSLGAAMESRSHLIDFHMKPVSDMGVEDNHLVTSSSTVDENRISAVTFGIIRNMIRSWSEDVAKRNRISSVMLEHLYRWITSSSSRLYDPAVYSLVHDLMKRVFIHLIADLRNAGCEVVYATFHKLVIATSKTAIPNAVSYVTYLLQMIKKKELFTHIDLKPTQVWEHLIWMDSFNYGGILCDNPDEAMNPALRELGDEDSNSSVDFRWNMAEYLPPACKDQFVRLTAEYIYEIHHFRRRNKALVVNKENDGPTTDIDNKKSKDLATFTKKLIGTTAKRRLLTIVRQLQRQEVPEDEGISENSFEFPVLPGSHLNMKNPALEFIKLVSKFFSLDPIIARESRLLRRDLLNLIGIREFSDEANFVNPCEAFSLPQVICDFCNHCQDLDLTRADDMDGLGDEYENGGARKVKNWSCSACHTLYDKVGIEQRMINIVRRRLVTWQLQDLNCERCKAVKEDEILDNCRDCSGRLGTELDRKDFYRKMKVFDNIAKFYGMEMLGDIMEWVMSRL
jgi:DNA polymerase epsilon subunit 1